MPTSSLTDQAIAVLRSNDTGVFTKPGPHQYPHQWNWDSALIALGLSHFDLPRAQAEIRALLSGQWQDGMVPSIVYHDTPSDYFPYPQFWQIENSPSAPGVPTTGITQPPLLATIVRLINDRVPNPDFIQDVYPSLLRWHRWLHTARDVDGSELACILHPWESGTFPNFNEGIQSTFRRLSVQIARSTNGLFIWWISFVNFAMTPMSC
jgi:hypothetical protein